MAPFGHGYLIYPLSGQVALAGKLSKIHLKKLKSRSVTVRLFFLFLDTPYKQLPSLASYPVPVPRLAHALRKFSYI